MASEISVETVCQFIASHGGKVKNSVLVSNFKKALNNPESRDVARQKFKECVNTVAVVKTENGDKFVQLKKKYRTPSLSASMSSVNSDSIDASSIASSDQQAPMSTFQTPQKHQEEPPSTHNTSFTPQADLPYADGASHKAHSPGLDETTDFPVHSAPTPPEFLETYDNVKPHPDTPEEVQRSATPPPPQPPSEPPVKAPEQRKSAQAENRKSQHASPEKERQTTRGGPPKKLALLTKSTEDEPEPSKQGLPPPRPLSTSLIKPESGEFAVPAAPRRKKIDRKENVPPSPSLESRFSHSVDRAKVGLQNAANDQGRVSRNRPISIMQTSYVGSVERARLNFQHKQRPSEDTASLALSLDSGRGEGDDDQERTAPPISLDPNEKLWIIKSCQGDMVEMRKLLDIEPNLAPTKDFIMGYTALHWAAKKGNIDMVNMLLDQKIDVNARSNGGYTPLHLAAMHGKEHVITHLLDYDADPSIRDYSGRQPIHYLKSVSLPLQSKHTRAMHERAPQWKRHLFSGTRHGHAVYEDTHERLDAGAKHATNKQRKASIAWEAPHQGHGVLPPEPHMHAPAGVRRSSSGSSGRRGSANGGSKEGKVSRKESVLKNLMRRPSQKKARTPDGGHAPGGEERVHDRGVFPSPPYKASPPMWKPAGPKTR